MKTIEFFVTELMLIKLELGLILATACKGFYSAYISGHFMTLMFDCIDDGLSFVVPFFGRGDGVGFTSGLVFDDDIPQIDHLL